MSSPKRGAPRPALWPTGLARGIRRLAVAGIILGICGAAAAQPTWLGGTWPPITVNTTIDNGWVVASGHIIGTAGPALWQTPLAPAGPPIVLRHGVSTTFVQVGDRWFVVDDASGRATQFGPGAVYRRWGPGTETPPPPPYATPSAPAPARPVAATPSTAPALTAAQEEALKLAAITQNRLQAALDRQSKLQKSEAPGSNALAEAALAVQAARIDVSLAQARVKDEFGSVDLPAAAHPSLPPIATAAPKAPPQPAAPRPAPPPLTKDESQAQKALLRSQAGVQIALTRLDQLHVTGAPEPSILDAKAKLADLRGAEEEALVAYRKSQLEADIQRAGSDLGQMDMPSRYQLYQDLYRVLDLTRERYRDETSLQDLRALTALTTGQAEIRSSSAAPVPAAKSAQYNRTAADLARVIKELESAQRDFAELVTCGMSDQSGTSVVPAATVMSR